MSLVLATAAAADVLTIAEMRDYLHLDATTVGTVTSHPDDDLLLELIQAVTADLDGADGMLNRCMLNQTWDMKLDRFPCGEIEIPLCRVSAVSSIKYFDSSNTEQTWGTANYQVSGLNTDETEICPVYGSLWPTTYPREEAVTVRFIAGYGTDGTSVPVGLRNLIKAAVAWRYENREVSGYPDGFMADAMKFKKWAC